MLTIVKACANSPLAWFLYLFMAVSLIVALVIILRNNGRHNS